MPTGQHTVNNSSLRHSSMILGGIKWTMKATHHTQGVRTRVQMLDCYLKKCECCSLGIEDTHVLELGCVLGIVPI